MGLGPSGPPATPKQLAYLKVLLEKAGFDDYRAARRPLGLSQRQGNGKFTRQEASELIDRLVNGENVDSPRPAGTAAERADDDKIVVAQAGRCSEGFPCRPAGRGARTPRLDGHPSHRSLTPSRRRPRAALRPRPAAGQSVGAPKRPASKSRNAWRSSASVFITNGP